MVEGPHRREGVMHWSEVERSQPRLAELGRRRLLEAGVVLVVTIRRDGRLWLSMLWRSRKAQDLARDPRVLVHSAITNREGGEGEFKIRGVARGVDDVETQRRYAAAVGRDLGWHPQPGRFHLFAVDIDQVTFIRYDNATGDQYVALWPPEHEFVRRGTSATSVGQPEHLDDILVDA